MQFTLVKKDPQSKARSAELVTSHGNLLTPVFMPVGTLGSVKGVYQSQLSNEIQAQIILGNTYHLYLRPGMEILKQAGGLHRFMNWPYPILSDSGGYQVYSLSKVRKISDNGVVFTSHIDGSKHLFTPEIVMDIQRVIGSDIIMAFDECPPYPCDHSYAANSLSLTHTWLKRCLDRFQSTPPLYGHPQSLFPIVQGGTFADLRDRSADFIAALGMDGNAIGGLSVGEPADEMYAMTERVCHILPEDKPRYLMGVGTPQNILESISLGIDMFDCVMPTRNGRNGMLFTKNGIINIRNEKWKLDFSPIEADSDLEIDKTYSKAYLRHLVHTGEMLGAQIASVHNLHFYTWLTREARNQILAGTFGQWKQRMVNQISNRL